MFVWGVFVWGVFGKGCFWQGGFLSRGFLSGGLCPGGFVWGVFVLEPQNPTDKSCVDDWVHKIFLAFLKLVENWRTKDEPGLC